MPGMYYWPCIAGGILLSGYGLWKMLRTKQKIDDVDRKIEEAKHELI